MKTYTITEAVVNVKRYTNDEFAEHYLSKIETSLNNLLSLESISSDYSCYISELMDKFNIINNISKKGALCDIKA